MKSLIFIFSLAIIGGLSKEWKNIDDRKESLIVYNKSAEKVIESSWQIILNTKSMASQFVEHLSNSYGSIISRLNETECYQTHFDPVGFQRSFLSEVLRSQVPLENLLIELRGKLDRINNTIYMSQDLADSKYLSCNVLKTNANCEEETNSWMDKIINTVHCELTPNCNSHVVSKRSTDHLCSAGKFRCGAKCISLESVCDRNTDCADGSDEDNCCYRHGYGSSGLYCSDNCFSHSSICDGKIDCDNGIDENHCVTRMNTSCSIEFGQHQCDSSKCIGLEEVCDGIKNCDDGTDESILCGNGHCPEDCAKRGGVCFLGPQGPRCLSECPLGTFESPTGCTAHPQPSNLTVMELLEDIPTLASRHQSRFAYLKMKATVAVSKMINNVIKCVNSEFPVFSKVVSFHINDQHNSTQRFDITTEREIDSTN